MNILSIILQNFSLISFLIIILGLILLWIIVSIPIYIAAKIVTSGKASLSAAMTTTLIGPIVYSVVLFIGNLYLVTLIGSSAYFFAFILAYISWLVIFKLSFSISWFKAFLISILAIIVFFIIIIIIGMILGIIFPLEYFPSPLFP